MFLRLEILYRIHYTLVYLLNVFHFIFTINELFFVAEGR